MKTTEKIEEIIRLMGEISEEDNVAGRVLLDGLGLSINVLETISKEDFKGTLDISDQINLVSNILGFSLEEMVMYIIKESSEDSLSDKEPDKETMDFLSSTVDVDDYEKFLEENKVKDNLNFLSKEI
jgi:hypothetical protein